ncbi:1-deoxy-D-xylulose-5-phosphate synthase [Oleiphilus messinensis]|uniref:1-deoxy-D-xylulose-5-phosphate synthase n=1 Tax=Oleiphilus messinensis TaxID=141451 RepID=A0A1Y0IFT8_9GAMM|nr:1-deoxy-D-xylulose-5-phosphate synthase [Oleiphilus messinensis]ARU58676.1 1-deoxy-D-xylulose-5-phosphate synthase [Oleiphilus messinensis]
MPYTHIFQEIPTHRPNTPLLDRVDSPAQLRLLNEEQLLQLAHELRAYLLYSVGQSGGHFGAGLGVIELTLALHYVYNTPEDRLVWDVGHQAYPHKILTGRRDGLLKIRQQGELSGFPKRDESIYDTFGVGHSSTSISAALGMSLAAKLNGEQRKAIAVIGDGAMTAGMAFEALNHAGAIRSDLLVVLNDNEMSISNNVGGLSNYFARILSSKTYQSMRDTGKKALSGTPQLMELARKTEEHFKGMVAPGTLFEELGFNYIGPIDGHNLPELINALENIREFEGPQFLHIVTKKGKGFAPAELDPIGYHAINKLAPTQPVTSLPPAKPKSLNVSKAPKFSNIFGRWICDMAERDKRLVGITPAMKEGSDLIEFAERFPARYHDVAIAEQHAVTLAAGLACEDTKPVVAIYSTFLQRAYDQLIHDVAIQDLDVLFAIDRAGLVGEDGATHAGSFDISFLRCIPNMVIMTPSDENQTRKMLSTGYEYCGPATVRYPRGSGVNALVDADLGTLPIGKGHIVREGSGTIAILAFGTVLHSALDCAEALNATVVDMRFVKPLDEELVLNLAANHELIVTVEENVVAGGAGSAVSEYLHQQSILVHQLLLGLPDEFVHHGKQADLLDYCRLSAAGIRKAIEDKLKNIRSNPASKLVSQS